MEETGEMGEILLEIAGKRDSNSYKKNAQQLIKVWNQQEEEVSDGLERHFPWRKDVFKHVAI